MKSSAGRKLSTPGEAYGTLYNALRALPDLKKAKAAGVDENFKERLMLAVTQVNGCAMCSYAHTQMALESGMTTDEIAALLSGEFGDTPPEELPALLFAQHYADSRGKPAKDSWERLVQLYGQPKSNAILGVVRMIMAGNTYGIPLGSLKARLNRNSKTGIDPRSSLPYELTLLLLLLPTLPVALLQAVAAGLLQMPPLRF